MPFPATRISGGSRVTAAARRPPAGRPRMSATTTRRRQPYCMRSKFRHRAARPALPICAPPIGRSPKKSGFTSKPCTVNPRDDKHGSGADDATGALAAVHPMVRTHPLSRERALYFHPTRATYIEGMTPEASREYLADLVMRTIEPAIVYDHNWVKGDVLVIDTRATLNRSADDFEPGESRILWRIVVEGDRPSLR